MTDTREDNMSEDDGLVYGYDLDGTGGGKAIGWDDLARPPSGAVRWLHMRYQSERVREWLRNAGGLDEITCEALLAEDTRPRLVTGGQGLLLTLRVVNCNPGEEPDDLVSLRVWAEPGRIITIRHRKVKAIRETAGALDAGNGPESVPDFLAMLTNNISARINDVVSDVDDRVDELENEILVGERRELRTKLTSIRRTVIGLRRYLLPQRDTLMRLPSERVSWLSDLDRARLREVAERQIRAMEDLDAARDRAAIASEELNSRLSEQMNQTIYVMSVVATIFLPLGLLTGLLGINVGGIPGTETQWAFAVVCLLLVLIAIAEFILFRRKRVL